MASKRKPETSSQKTNDRADRDATRRRKWLALVAILLAITFIAGECSALLPA